MSNSSALVCPRTPKWADYKSDLSLKKSRIVFDWMEYGCGDAKVRKNKLFPTKLLIYSLDAKASKQMNLWRKFRINDKNLAQNWYPFYYTLK